MAKFLYLLVYLNMTAQRNVNTVRRSHDVVYWVGTFMLQADYNMKYIFIFFEIPRSRHPEREHCIPNIALR